MFLSANEVFWRSRWEGAAGEWPTHNTTHESPRPHPSSILPWREDAGGYVAVLTEGVYPVTFRTNLSYVDTEVPSAPPPKPPHLRDAEARVGLGLGPMQGDPQERAILAARAQQARAERSGKKKGLAKVRFCC